MLYAGLWVIFIYILVCNAIKGAYSSSWNSPQNYETPLVKWDHTVLSATRQRWPPRYRLNTFKSSALCLYWQNFEISRSQLLLSTFINSCYSEAQLAGIALNMSVCENNILIMFYLLQDKTYVRCDFRPEHLALVTSTTLSKNLSYCYHAPQVVTILFLAEPGEGN